jgi:hypothetical protein
MVRYGVDGWMCVRVDIRAKRKEGGREVRKEKREKINLAR